MISKGGNSSGITMKLTEPILGNTDRNGFDNTALYQGDEGDKRTKDVTLDSSYVRRVNGLVENLKDRDYDSFLERMFHITSRGTTWQMEVICGLVQFISCVYVLPVVPLQLENAGFDVDKTVIATVYIFSLLCYNSNLSKVN